MGLAFKGLRFWVLRFRVDGMGSGFRASRFRFYGLGFKVLWFRV